MNKYLKIRNDVRNDIISGKYKPGELLPNENDFSAIYNTSKMTVKHAMDELVREGLIIKRRGSGTFVKELNQQELESLKVASQFQGTTALYPNKKIKSDVLVFELVPPSRKLMDDLHVNALEKLYHVKRVRTIDNVPFVIEDIYMPADIIKDLTLSICESSIYEYIEDQLKLSLGSAHRKIEARKVTEEERPYLELEAGEPVVVSSQVAFLSDGRAFESSQSIHRADHFAFETVIIRRV